MLARRAGDRQHVVEAHADVGDRNGPGGGGEALGGPAGRDARRRRSRRSPAISPPWRSSRHIFHATHSNSSPPARIRPTICSSWVTIKRESDAQHQRGEHADHDHLAALLGRQAGRQRADDDRIVAGQDQVDHQHLDEGGKGAPAR